MRTRLGVQHYSLELKDDTIPRHHPHKVHHPNQYVQSSHPGSKPTNMAPWYHAIEGGYADTPVHPTKQAVSSTLYCINRSSSSPSTSQGPFSSSVALCMPSARRSVCTSRSVTQARSAPGMGMRTSWSLLSIMSSLSNLHLDQQTYTGLEMRDRLTDVDHRRRTARASSSASYPAQLPTTAGSSFCAWSLSLLSRRQQAARPLWSTSGLSW